MKRLLVLSLWTLFSIPVFAQEHFISGSIILKTGDTLKGQIDYRDWELNPSSIRFRNASGEIKTFSPSMIAGFTDGRELVFWSARLAIDISNYTLTDLLTDDTEKIVRDTSVFVKVLVRGQLCLYYLKDKNDKDHFWFRNGQDSAYEMRISRKVKKTGEGAHSGTQGIATLNLYQIILPGIVEDCPGVAEQAKKAGFSIQDFTGIALKYNECRGSKSFSVVHKTKKVKARFGLIAGASAVNLRFHGAEEIPITHASFPGTWTWMGGVALKVILPYLNGSWIIYNDLVYRPYSASGSYDSTNILIPNSSDHYEWTFNMGYLKLNTMLRYQYPKWAVKPFVNLGISNSYAVINDSHCTQTFTWHGTSEVTEGPAIQETKNYEIGFICGLGACFRGFGFEFRFETANGMSAYSTLTAAENSYSFLLSYTFGEK